MPKSVSGGFGLAMAACAVLLVSACGGGDRADDVSANTFDDANLILEEPANDQSAVEAAANATDIEPLTNTGNSAEDDNVLGETSGGDTGGNTVESNVSGT
jgi:hypothetical protein